MTIGSMYPNAPIKVAGDSNKFFCVGERWYQMSPSGRIRIQLGQRNLRGRIHYKLYKSCGDLIILGWYVGLNVAPPYIKRLSYKASETGRYIELARYEPA